MIDRASVQAAIDRVAAAMEREFEALNAADAALGDGDLGVTMTRGMRLVQESAADLPEDLGQALLRCAQAFTKSSGSSYGTLMATALMALARDLKGPDRSVAGGGVAPHGACTRRDHGAGQGGAGRQDGDRQP